VEVAEGGKRGRGWRKKVNEENSGKGWKKEEEKKWMGEKRGE
jgi:hypothetical protein